MNTPAHYSTQRAKRSLWQFLLGKGCSAGVGIAVLLLTVRILTPGDFGRFVAAIAFLEIFYLATGFGLSAIAQRYVAEFRVKAGSQQFTSFLLGMLARRLAFAAAGALLVAGGATVWAESGAPSLPVDISPVFLGLLVAGCITRYLDEIFPALLLQGYTQGLVLAAHCLRLCGLILLPRFGIAIGFSEIVLIELGAALVCTLGGALLLWRYLTSESAHNSTEHHDNPRMWPVARRFYLVQLLGQAWSPNAGKLIVSERLGLAVTAGYGFIQSLTDMARNYLPAYLLANWLRPLMVSRYLKQGDLLEVNAMASLMFKLSLMCIVPLAVFFLAWGDRFVEWLSAGKFTEGSALLTAFCMLLACQSLHAVVTMITATVERPEASVVATVASCIALPLAWLGANIFGAIGVVGAMVAGEGIWIATVILLLRRSHLSIAVDPLGTAKIILSALPAYILATQLPATLHTMHLAIIGLSLSGMTVLAINAFLKPFLAAERAFITRLIPARLFVW